MAPRSEQKLKLLYIIDILRHSTDEDHPISAPEICKKLAANGITAERKAIYGDIETLIDFGYDIIKTRVPKAGYFLASREFEVPEIYLLSDAVRTARFISAKKTRELVSKLDGMLSDHQAKKRNKGIYIDSMGKCTNEEIYYNIDAINRAIENRHKIILKYGVRELGPNREIETVLKQRKISPYAMTWQDDHYYLIGNYEKYDNLIHMRIDRMRSVTETDESIRHFSEVCDYTDVFDVADYTKKLFSMFGGDAQEIELRCNKRILEQLTDRFGENIFIRNVSDTHFEFSAKAVVSGALVTWIMNYGDDIEVKSPQILRDMITDRAQQILQIYNK